MISLGENGLPIGLDSGAQSGESAASIHREGDENFSGLLSDFLNGSGNTNRVQHTFSVAAKGPTLH
jgi:hypothetical protein